MWSITYHSWLTFLFLVTACIVWMTPRRRAVCLCLSPLTLLYAVALIVIQYVWGLQLTPAELPTATSGGYPFKEIGLVKETYACVPLAIQVTTRRSAIGEFSKKSIRFCKKIMNFGIFCKYLFNCFIRTTYSYASAGLFQIGFTLFFCVTPRQSSRFIRTTYSYASAGLFQIGFTLFFWVTMRQFSRERNVRRARSHSGALPLETMTPSPVRLARQQSRE